ncbi:MAG TPA: hypothetical protein VGU22_09895 [Methylomirabilota bacterium]|nr:hypothetical protein [Methylomirabilota bacterium]
MDTQRARSSSSLDLPRRRLKTLGTGVTLWRPQIVLATAIDPVAPTAPVALAGPALRPEAVQTRATAARSRLGSLNDARQTLGARLVTARARVEQAASMRERVEATMHAYRVERSLDNVLTGTLREVTAMMEERGLR